MEKSLTIDKLAKALKEFQSKVGNVKKDSTNPFFHSKYASLENIVNTIKQPLAEAGLSFSQIPCGENQLLTILMHESGEYISAVAKMTPKDSSPQAQGSAITYLRRYALASLLGLVTEDDDDGNLASKSVSAKKTSPRAVSSEVKGTEESIRQPYVPKTAVTKIKQSIAKSVSLLNDPTKDLSADEIKDFVLKKTGLELVEKNYEEIDALLLVLLSEGK